MQSNKKVRDLMSHPVRTLDRNDMLSIADTVMRNERIRHLPVVDDGRPVTVVSIRDLLSEAVAHHAKIIAELERERMTIFTSTA